MPASNDFEILYNDNTPLEFIQRNSNSNDMEYFENQGDVFGGIFKNVTQVTPTPPIVSSVKRRIFFID